MSDTYDALTAETYDEKRLYQIQLEAASAQRLLNDEHWKGFLADVMSMAVDQAILSPDKRVRNDGRAMALAIRQLRAHIERAAGMPQELRERQEQEKKFE